MPDFTHLHVHSQYSILDGAASIPALIEKVKSSGMSALALTDHGIMLGIKEFHATCLSNDVKPIIGCEAYVARRTLYDRNQPTDKSGYHLIILAKNYKGYENLMKMMSIANLEGFYMRPRIDKKLLEKYHEGLIVSSACLGGEIPKHITNGDLEEAGKTIEWYKNIFGEDFYLEVMHHPTENERLKREVSDVQLLVNEKILELGQKHNVKVIATNDSHFTNEEDAEAHDVLICLTTNADINEPNRLRYTQSEWLKTPEEMEKIFGDHPEVLSNTMEIAEKVEVFEINKDPIMPEFPIPEEFGTIELWQEKFNEEALINEFGEERYKILGGYKPVLRIKFESDYLSHLVEVGATERYGKNYSDEIQERLDFELNTIKTMGFPGYFLIVQDFIAAGRKMGVLIGKGRGSAAGSAVAYCTKITDVDPIKFDLLFERFLNPDRISMPDVDIDFDDDGRAQVVDYVTKKYGKDKVAHICTIGTMKAKGALRDVARILRVPLGQINDFTKKIPNNGSLSNSFKLIMEDNKKLGSFDKVISEIDRQIKKAYKEDDDKIALKLETRKVIAEEMLVAESNNDQTMLKTIDIACTLEGSVRQTGVHACGILIGSDSLESNIPLMRTKEAEGLAATQYEGKYVEDIGLLKMDFLGLKTLSIIKECLSNIKLSKGIDLDIDSIPMDDDKTLDVFRTGSTTSIFQFESEGMKSHLKNLKPTHFNDLVAMNALYRPGPMEYIPDYINRKHGKEKTVYDHPIMEKFLKYTYGITVFQEQVMLQSRALGQFTRGESDSLRKAMGKKKIKEMEKLHVKFVDGCLNNPEFIQGCEKIKKDPKELIDKIWKDWSAFAKYAFNKSHSVCYAYVAYQTAYLKAHFPAEFMAANMTRNISDMDKISVQMSECRRMKIKVLSPDVNESYRGFTVNKEGNIRFGMAGIKNVGSNAVENIIEERAANGPYKDIFDFVSRVNLNAVNKKNIEALAFAGALDCFKEIKRPQFFAPDQDNESFIESLIKFGHNVQSSNNAGLTLFGEMQAMEISNPTIPDLPDYDMLKFLDAEKEHIGMYVSGHPLEPFKYIISNMNTKNLRELDDEANKIVDREFRIVGFITEVTERMTKNGKPFGKISMIDYTGSFTFTLFGKDYTDNKNLFVKGYSVMIVAKYVEGYNDKTKRYFNVNKVMLLSEIKENYFSKITISLPIENVTDDFIGGLTQLIKKNKGKININFQLFSGQNKTSVNLFSRTERVNLSDDIIDFLENNNNIVKVSLN
ncbi:MAG: DNA polymerase III subunit alpha [Marinilabiliales bacterium]|nr:MAG: DNA polymerase III subunit alpha [Marinilabiliales bacterium]